MSQTESTVIGATDLRASLGDFALSIPDLRLELGESMAIVGPTGSGKTTLLRLLSGLLAPTSGQVHWEKQRVDAASVGLADRRRAAFVHQSPELIHGTVFDNVALGLRMRRASDIDSRVASTLTRLHMTSFSRQPVATLSVGQRQLVGLARAIVLEPAMLFLDEPTASLDPSRVAIVEDAIQSLRLSQPMIVVWATHNLHQARRIGDRACLLWDGELVECSDCESFFESPKESRTSDFINGRVIY